MGSGLYLKSIIGCLNTRNGCTLDWAEKRDEHQDVVNLFVDLRIGSEKKRGPLYGPSFGAVCTIFSYMGSKKRHPFWNSFRGFVSFRAGQIDLAVGHVLIVDCPAWYTSLGMQPMRKAPTCSSGCSRSILPKPDEKRLDRSLVIAEKQQGQLHGQRSLALQYIILECEGTQRICHPAHMTEASVLSNNV